MRTQDLLSRRPRWLARLIVKRKSLWMGAAKLGLGLACLQYAVVRPLASRTERLGTEVRAVSQRMDGLVASRAGVENANDLLTALAAQESSLRQARQALTEIRMLRAGIEDEARQTSLAQDRLAKLLELQSQLAASGRQIESAQGAVESLAALTGRAEALGTNSAARLADLQRAIDMLDRLGALKDGLLADAETIDAAAQQMDAARQVYSSLAASGDAVREARERSDELIQLAETVGVVGKESLESAARNVDGLIAVHDTLADAETLRLQEAERTLRQLLAIEAELGGKTGDVAAAVENLDLLSDFHKELTRQLATLEGLRRELSEIALLKDTVDRVSAAVGPLAELSSLRRMNDAEVRSMARQILEQRTAQTGDEPASVPVKGMPRSVVGEGTVERIVPEPRAE
jgi:hypothetical protein